MAKERKQHKTEEERKLDAKNEIKEYTEKISKKRNEIKNYVKSFKADVKRKKKSYHSYAKKLQKEKILTNKNEN